MPTARTYENMELIDKPFEEDGKLYVKVRGNCTRCGGSGHYSYNQMDGTRCYGCNGTGKQTIKVRWYTDSQRASMDKAAEKRKQEAEKKRQEAEERRKKYDPRINARTAFGFGDDGFIMLLRGKHDEIMDWKDSLPQYSIFWNEFFHWYIPSENYKKLTVPENLKVTELSWDKVAEDEAHIIDHEEVKRIVRELTAEESKSQWQGNPGEWLNPISVKVVKNIVLDSRYGVSHMHILQDENENVYVWTTGSKDYPVDKILNLKMKVKEHSEYDGVKQTVVWYCKEK